MTPPGKAGRPRTGAAAPRRPKAGAGARRAAGRAPLAPHRAEPDTELAAHLAALGEAFDAAPFVVWARDRTGRIILQNRASNRFWGSQMGRTPSESGADPSVVEAWEKVNRRAYAGRTVRQNADYVVAGKTLHFLNIVTPLRIRRRIVGLLGFLIDITAQKRTEEALRASEARLRVLTDNAADAIFIKDAARRYTFLNPAAVRLLGLARSRLIGKTPEEVFDAPDARAVRAADDATFEGHRYDATVELASPVRRHVLHTIQSPITGPDGRVEAICGIVRDVTARVEADRALAASEERYRLMVEAVPLLAWRSDAQGGFLEANSRWHTYTGIPPGRTRGTGWLKALHPADRKKIAAAVDSAVRGDGPRETEYRLRRASDGRYRWHLSRALPSRDASGRVTGWFGACVDIHEQKAAEERLEERVRERTAALRASEARVRRVIDGSNDGYWDWDVPRDLLAVSDRFRRIAGLPRGRGPLPRADVWRFVHPDDLPRAEAVRRGTLASAAGDDRHEMEIRLRPPGGGVTWVRTRAVVIRRDAHGQPVQVSGTITDVTARRHAEEEVRRRTRQLAQLASELTMAEHRERRRVTERLHEGLQQQLIGARMQAQALLSDPGPVSRERLASLVQSLTDAAAEARAITQELASPMLVHESLGDALRWATRFMRDRHRLEVELKIGRVPADLPEATAVLLHTAVRELLFNIAKHAHTRHARVRLGRRRGAVVLDVSDDGAGCAPSALAARDGATGFGLFSIRERAELLGGTLAVKSAPGKGMRVTLSLPMPGPAGERGPGSAHA